MPCSSTGHVFAWDLGGQHVQCEKREEAKVPERQVFTNLKQVETEDETL